jgi:hypothetical protein
MEIHEKYQIPIIKRGRVGIPLTLSHFCTCPKPGPGFPTPYVAGFTKPGEVGDFFAWFQ